MDLEGVDIGESFKISSVKLDPEVVPTIQGRDFVIATLAAPTVMKEPEKPADKSATDGDKKDSDDKKSADKKPTDKKPSEEKK